MTDIELQEACHCPTRRSVTQNRNIGPKAGPSTRLSIASRFLAAGPCCRSDADRGCICGGHAVLGVGLPGLGKTRMSITLSTVHGSGRNRIRLPLTLSPAISGSEVLDSLPDGTRQFPDCRRVRSFARLLMADEINRASRAPSQLCCKAMPRTRSHDCRPAPPPCRPFHVLRRRTRCEQEGTYPLPEAQLTASLCRSTCPPPPPPLPDLATGGVTPDRPPHRATGKKQATAVFTADGVAGRGKTPAAGRMPVGVRL